MKRSAITLLILLIVAGCSWTRPGPLPAGFQGKELFVVKPLMFGSDQYSVYFQDGIPVSQRDLTIWDYYCNLRLNESRPEAWKLEHARYKLAGFKAYSELCDRFTCDLVNEYTLGTYSGPQASVLTCRRRASIDDQSGLLLEVLTPRQLEAILGDTVQIR
jgi:hypothetical protein